MNKVAVGAVAAVVVVAAAGGGYAWAMRRGQAEVQAAADQIRAGLGPNGSFAYASSSVNPFRRSAELSTVTLRTAAGLQVTADRVTVASSGPGLVSALHADALRAAGGPVDGTLTAATLDAKDLAFPPAPPGGVASLDPAVVTVGSASLRSLAVASADASGTADAVEVSNYGIGRPSAFSVAGLSMAAPAFKPLERVGFDAVRGTGIDLATAVNAIERRGGRPQVAVGPTSLEIVSPYATQGTAKPFSAQSVRLATESAPDGARSEATLTVAGLAFVPVDEEPREKLALVKLDRIVGRLAVHAAYQKAGGRFELAPTAEIDGLGKLESSLALTNLDGSLLADGGLGALMAVGQAAQLASTTTHVTDAGLLDRMLGMWAQQANETKEQVRAETLAQVAADQSYAAMQNSAELRAALTAYLTNGHELSVTFTPVAPVNLFETFLGMQLNPDEVAGKIKVTASGR